MGRFFNPAWDDSRAGALLATFFGEPSLDTSLFSIAEASDVFSDACVRGNNGELLFLSVYGREAGLQQFMAALQLPPSSGGIASFRLAQTTEQEKPIRHTILVGDARRLEKLVGKFPKGNLFGSLSHMWIFDPRVKEPDRSTHSAWMLFASPASDAEAIDEIVEARVWETVNTLSPIPLMKHWRSVICRELNEWGSLVNDLKFPPIGEMQARYLELPDDFGERISALIRNGKLAEGATEAFDPSCANHQLRAA